MGKTYRLSDFFRNTLRTLLVFYLKNRGLHLPRAAWLTAHQGPLCMHASISALQVNFHLPESTGELHDEIRVNSLFVSLLPKCAQPFYEHLRLAYGKASLYGSFLLSQLCPAPKIYSECYMHESQHLWDECPLAVCESEFCPHDTSSCTWEGSFNEELCESDWFVGGMSVSNRVTEVGGSAHCGWNHSLGLDPGLYSRGKSKLNNKHAYIPYSLFLALNLIWPAASSSGPVTPLLSWSVTRNHEPNNSFPSPILLLLEVYHHIRK